MVAGTLKCTKLQCKVCVQQIENHKNNNNNNQSSQQHSTSPGQSLYVTSCLFSCATALQTDHLAHASPATLRENLLPPNTPRCSSSNSAITNATSLLRSQVHQLASVRWYFIYLVAIFFIFPCIFPFFAFVK